MKTESIQLGKICDFIKGVSFDLDEVSSLAQNDFLPILRAGNISDKLDTKNKLIWIPKSRVSEQQKMRKDDIAICMSSGSSEVVGKTARLNHSFNGSVGAFCGIIRPKSPESASYISHWFLSKEFLRWRDSKARGANIQNLSFSAFSSIAIPLPPLPEQKRIAAILDKADRLRRQRRFAQKLSDSFLQSVFVKMFGDIVSNSKGWKTTPLGKIASVQRGKFSPRPRNDPKFYGGEFPFIQTGDITRSEGFLVNWTQTLNKHGVKVSRAFDIGTIVIAIVGATIGETAILGIKAYCPDSVIGIEVNSKFSNSEYVEYLLRFWKPVFRAMAPETARANINLETLRPIPVPLPPLPLQEKFAEIVQKFERIRRQQREATRQAEHLFQTLLHRAFRGEL